MSPRALPSTVHALFGVLATALGVAAGHFVAALTEPSASPVLAVGSTVIDATPVSLKEWAIAHFGSNDKTVLVGSVLVVVLLLSAVAGVLARRRLAAGAGLLLVLVVLAGAAALTRPTAGAADVLPSVVAAVVGIGALVVLERLAGRSGAGAHRDRDAEPGAEPDAEPDSGPSRRGVLVGAGTMAVAAAVLGGIGRWITSYRTRPEDISLPPAADPAPPLPTGLEKKVDGITPLRTPRGEFYRVDTRLTLPVVDVDSWTLTIDGDVEQEVSFTFDDLTSMDLLERDITLTCVSNDVGGPYVGGARWLGVPLTILLDRAGIDATKADQILCTDVDGMTISVPLDVATDGRDAMIAIGMDGAALPREHGFPARMVVPGLYGFVSACKWISKMTLTTYDAQQAYWTEREWATEAPIKIASRIDVPRPLATIDPGRTFIGGIAWAQHQGGISKIEVRIDGGAWQQAKLGPEVNSDYWRQWYLPWDASSGQHTLAVRAYDGEGDVQTSARATPFPDGSSGIQQIVVTVS